MVNTAIATVRPSTLRHSVLMAASAKSTAGTSSKTLRMVVRLVATVTRSEPRLIKPTLEATSHILSDTSTVAQLSKATDVAGMTMKAATALAVMGARSRAATDGKRRAATAVATAVAKRRAAMAAVTVVVRSAMMKAAMAEVTAVAMNAAKKGVTVVAAAVTSVVGRVVTAAVAATEVDMEVRSAVKKAATVVAVVVMSAVKRADTATTAMDAETKVVSAEALLTTMFVKAKEATEDVSVVVATSMMIMATAVTDAGKLGSYVGSVYKGVEMRLPR